MGSGDPWYSERLIKLARPMPHLPGLGVKLVKSKDSLILWYSLGLVPGVERSPAKGRAARHGPVSTTTANVLPDCCDIVAVGNSQGFNLPPSLEL